MCIRDSPRGVQANYRNKDLVFYYKSYIGGIGHSVGGRSLRRMMDGVKNKLPLAPKPKPTPTPASDTLWGPMISDPMYETYKELNQKNPIRMPPLSATTCKKNNDCLKGPPIDRGALPVGTDDNPSILTKTDMGDGSYKYSWNISICNQKRLGEWIQSFCTKNGMWKNGMPSPPATCFDFSEGEGRPICDLSQGSNPNTGLCVCSGGKSPL